MILIKRTEKSGVKSSVSAEVSNEELLKYALENGIINLECIQNQIEMTKREAILKKCTYWEGRDKKWYTHLPDEKRTLKKLSTKEKMEDFLVSYHKEKETRPCFREVYSEWIQEKTEYEEIKKDSITRYDNDFERFFPKTEEFCKIPLYNMTNSILEKFIKKKIKEKKLTAKKYAMLRLILNGVFKYAYREGYTKFSIHDFFNNLSLPKNIFEKKVKKRKEELSFSIKESETLISYFINNPTKVNVGLHLIFLSGLRVGEMSCLNIKDNVKPNLLLIENTELTYKDKEIGKRVTIISDTPKTENREYVIIPDEAQKLVDRLKENCDSSEGFLFTKDGKRVTSRMFNYYLQKACREVGIPPRSPHKIRKTYGSILQSNKLDDTFVADQMGHKDISTTRQYYYYDVSDNEDEKKNLINKVVSY